MGKVVLADGGFGGFTSFMSFCLMITDNNKNNYESLDNRLTYGCEPVKSSRLAFDIRSSEEKSLT